MTFEEARAQFPVLEQWAYLQAGSAGPLPRAAFDASIAWLERDLAEGRGNVSYVLELAEVRDRIRSAFAAVLGAAPEQIALTDSTTRGCQIVLAGLGLGADDEIVTTEDEHFGLLGPLHASGARVVVVAPDEESIVAAVGEHTRLIATSHVLWTTGRRFDLARLKEPGLPLLVDGAQSAGAIPVDLDGADFYTVSAQKWLCGPEPTGALYVRDPERLPARLPSYVGQAGYEPAGRFTPKDGAARFDSGWLSGSVLAGLEASLACHPEWRYERAAEMAARCRELLEPVSDVVTPPGHSTLVSFRPPARDAPALVASLYERGVVVRDLPGRGLVRASCGWWTSGEDLQRLVEGVAAV